jgi:hypothetical protein
LRVLTSTSSSEWSVLQTCSTHPRTRTCGILSVGSAIALLSFSEAKQREILVAVVRHRYVAIKSAHDAGKGPQCLSRRGVVARYEQRRLYRRPSRCARFCGVRWPGSSQGNLPGRRLAGSEVDLRYGDALATNSNGRCWGLAWTTYNRGLPSPDCADGIAIAFAGRANAALMNVDSHAGESIMGDLMTKAW